MRQTRKGFQGRWFGVVGVVITVFATVGATAYFLSSSSKKVPGENKASRCVVVTESVAASRDVDWNDLLSEDTVLLIAPGVLFPGESVKVIRCDTMLGLWSCVKHLKKDHLLLNQNELEGKVPDDIPRYVKNIFDITCLQDT